MVDTPISKLTAAAAPDGDEPVIISQRSATVIISAATISALASDNSFNDSADGFVAAGFSVGNYVNVMGFTGDTANNIFSGEITALTAGKMTIGGADGDVIVDDAAGEMVVISKWESRRIALDDLAGRAPFELVIAVSDEATALTAGSAKVTFRMPCAVDLDEVRASVTTAPTGSAITVDINESGSTILSTKLTIDASEKTSASATPPVISDAALADDAEITIDIDAVGSTIAGAGLKVSLIGRRA